MTGLIAKNGRAHPLVGQMFDIMREQKRPVLQFTTNVGIHHKTMVRWRYSNCPTLLVFEACLHELGYELAIVRRAKVSA